MTIAQVSKEYGLTPDTLRYYEKIGLIPPVHRNHSGIRDYNDEDCRWVEFAKCMRKSGLQIDALVRYVTLFSQGDQTFFERKQLLIEQRKVLASRMADMQKSLDRLDKKLAHYDETMAQG